MAFRFNCSADLYKDLGRYDAIVEFTEIAIRDFIEQAQLSGDFDLYLQEKSVEHKIRVNTVDQSVFRSRISVSYILSVYQSAELFLHQLTAQYNDLYDADLKLDGTTDNLLIKTLRQISKINSATSIIGEHRLAIFDYYRLVRNKYSHDRITTDRMLKEFVNISGHSLKINDDYPGITAPNNFQNISFDDFILFSRTIKDIADKITAMLIPTDEQLKAFYDRKELYKELTQNKSRRVHAIKGHMRTNFGIEDQQANIVIGLVNISLA